MEEKQGAAGQAVGGITSERADLSDEVLSGDVWEREGLSPRDRSLVALIALCRSASTSCSPRTPHRAER
ncbi:hypothetical protein [Streptomyces californicus]|uniref:hypothetical protein n=1 Tax=Streptomyces californicus TaxID=67351 RepID=UPI003320636A